MVEECVFCALIRDRSRVPYWVAESERALAFLDLHPIRVGHTLVVPKAHARDLTDVSAEDWRAMGELARLVAGRLRARGGTTGENLFLASGPGSDQTVFHVHLHILPRRADDAFGLRDWWERRAASPSPAELEALAVRLRR